MPQSETVEIPKRLPLIAQPENRNDSTTKDARLINGYMERAENSGESHVYKRPGLAQTGTTKSGNGYGVYNWLGNIYSIFGSTLYKDGVAVSGSLDTAGGIYHFSQSLGATLRMQLGNGVASYNYDDTDGLVRIEAAIILYSAGSFVVGTRYIIIIPGTTDFTLIGAADSIQGTVFTATGAGTGTGVASSTPGGTFSAIAALIAAIARVTAAGFFIEDTSYVIYTVGTTDFTLVGAADNNVGTVFIATGEGSGTGQALPTSASTNFPNPAVKGWAYLDGTTYVGTPSADIRGCAEINDPTDWSDVGNTLSAQIEADNGVALAKQLVYVLLLGQWSTEVFYDQANATGSPLGPVQGAKINYGCVHADSVQDVDGALLWLASNRSAAPQIILVENLKFSIVSTKPIERILGEADMTTIYSFKLKFDGHSFYGITSKNSNITLVYDLTDRLWSQWTDVNGNYWPIVASTFSESFGLILQHETNGKLYLLDAAYTTDDGAAITFEIYTPNFDGGTRRRKTLNVMEFIADQTPGSVLHSRCNDHDYAADKWTNFRTIDLSLKKPILIGNGTFTRRAYHFRHRCATRLRLQAVELQLDLGTL